ncbi:MAG: nucleotidyltransferase family protein [Candidatus Omnitrophota bacterium]
MREAKRSSLKKIKEILNEHKNELKERHEISEIGIFGSYVRGEQKKNSDIDILVEFGRPVDFFEYLELEEYLSKLLKVNVDLVMKKALRPIIGKHILREAVYV